MSRIGKLPVPIPSGVELKFSGTTVSVRGPKGILERQLPPKVEVKVEDGKVVVAPLDTSDRVSRSMYGLTRTLIANMVQGVQKPFSKSLEVVGVGYRAELKGDKLNLQVGLSHDVNVVIPKTMTCKVDKLTTIHLESPDKELVGRIAAEIRSYRPCEPYKGKGIKYTDERVRRKEGKTGT
ncbi:MAG: 50S ribosomal protein L6 [Myxococcales bacterium]|nr:50S ribosomal protein L6 [Myxococcales bacterium]